MVRKLVFIITIVFAVACTAALSACGGSTSTTDRELTRQIFTVRFAATDGGRIEGDALQRIEDGKATHAVLAVADIGYYFAGWSDEEVLTDETVTRSERTVENVSFDAVYTANFKKKMMRVSYVAGENGTITGAPLQTIEYGEYGESVTAVPNVGYYFCGWSDGVDDATRIDKATDENIELTARFEIIAKTYTYDYKYADSGCDKDCITITFGQLDKASFAVPTREHGIFCGWYADRYLTRKVADENGNAVIGDELFDIDSKTLYARWIAENDNPYKILIVYVTELNAELRTVDGNGTKQLNYSMTDTERQICRMLTEKIAFELNDLAVADFQVDEYFTTIPLTEENVTASFPANSDNLRNNLIWAYNISEIRDMLGSYDSIIVSFNMNDYIGEFHTTGGSAILKFGQVHFDSIIVQLLDYNEQLEALLDPTHYYWDHMLLGYLHELIHTMELTIYGDSYYHMAESSYMATEYLGNLTAEKLFLLNKAVVEGQTVGIPYAFWERKIAVVHYEATEGGGVFYSEYHYPTYGQNNNDDIQYVIFEYDAIAVTARAYSGYEFIGWSDGIDEAYRHDTHITEDLHVYAIFRPI